MLVTLEEVKNYLRLDDFTEDDQLITLMIQNAEIYIGNLITIDETDTNMMAQVKLLILILVTDMYENRQLHAENTSEKIRYIVQSTILQVRYCYLPDEEVDTL